MVVTVRMAGMTRPSITWDPASPTQASGSPEVLGVSKINDQPDATKASAALVAGIASLRPRPGDVVGYAVRIALRELGRRAQFPGGQLQRPGELIVPLVTARVLRQDCPCGYSFRHSPP
jgi:hypothetical protein